MIYYLLLSAAQIFSSTELAQNTTALKNKISFYELETKTIRGKKLDFASLKDQVVLIVNTASKCGYTPQYKGLEALHKKYSSKRLKVIGFPSNDFGGQEPGSEKEIAKFCKFNYGVTFSLSSKVKTRGVGQSSVYRFLTNNAPEKGEVKWNFEKFLISRDGKIIKRFRSNIKPQSAEIIAAINKALAEK